MNIIELAKEAGLIRQRGNLDVVSHSITQIERFAALVRADAFNDAANVCGFVRAGGVGDIGDDAAGLCESIIRGLK